MKQTTLLLMIMLTISLASCEHGYFLIEQSQDAAREKKNAAREKELDARFDRLEKHLGVSPDKKDASSKSVAVAFPPESFPRSTCGDKLPNNNSAYPLKYYPIFIKNTKDNLQAVKERFCADAFVMKDKVTGEEFIQVASFYTQKGSEFLLLMEQNFGETILGTETVIIKPF